ncbi:hypothetical protein QRB35_17320 [Mycobacterium intracellulare subsp. chimaera]|uniref:Uncharacterized protein n=1 Tax=Mycobacterium intracellulare subsp. chimaera TaxID=222805 RepID=A0ABT7P3Z7_MYCIT|nr:hypothetical protein [Mycobacterium intracellulare subsp. chimaera]
MISVFHNGIDRPSACPAKQSIGSLLATAHKPAEVHEENVSHQHPTTATKTARQ